MSNKTYTLDDLRIRQQLDPTLEVEELTLPNTETNDENAIKKNYSSNTGAESKMYAFIPYIKINNVYTISPLNIMEFNIGIKDFMPTIYIRVADTGNDIKSKYYPKNGSVLNVYIGTIGDEKKYKPYRMDFLITSISESGNMFVNYKSGGSSIYSISGIVNIPELLYNNNICKSGTSYETLKGIAEELKLGFSSNVDGTNDDQLWLNGTNEMSEFIKGISDHAYFDDDSFFDVFIDPYYNLNFVEMNREFYIGGDNDTCTVYKTAHFEEDDPENSYQLEEQYKSEEDKKDMWAGREKEHEYEITNSNKVNGWSLFFKDYTVIGNNDSSIYDGYEKEVQWWDYEKREYISKPVVPFCYETNGLMPLNKGRLKDGEVTKVNNIKTYSRQGNETEEISDTYRYAGVCNSVNMQDCKKFGLVVNLPCVNPAITRGSRIKVSVFEHNEIAQDGLVENLNMTEDSSIKTDDGKDVSLNKLKQYQNNTTPRYDIGTDEGLAEAKSVGIYSTLQEDYSYSIDGSANIKGDELLNESLSGYYVVMGYEIYLNESTGNVLYQKLYLNRKEYKPPLKTDFKNMNPNKD